VSGPDPEIAVDIVSGAWESACTDAASVACAAAWSTLARSSTAAGVARGARIELSVVLTSDTEQRRLNRDWRGVDRSTNVLAFPAWEAAAPAPPDAPVLLGDVVLACETVLREADEQHKTPADHLSHLIVHGVLHLLGYDHGTDAEAAAMERREISILASLGVADPYRRIM
jgi:probable rRNA maturation factor